MLYSLFGGQCPPYYCPLPSSFSHPVGIDYPSSRNLRGSTILKLNGKSAISRRSASPVTRKSAFASMQHSSNISSFGSLQSKIFLFGFTISAFDTTAAIPEIKALNCRWLIFPSASSAKGTSRYSFKRAGVKYMSASENAFFTAFSAFHQRRRQK